MSLRGSHVRSWGRGKTTIFLTVFKSLFVIVQLRCLLFFFSLSKTLTLFYFSFLVELNRHAQLQPFIRSELTKRATKGRRTLFNVRERRGDYPLYWSSRFSQPKLKSSVQGDTCYSLESPADVPEIRCFQFLQQKWRNFTDFRSSKTQKPFQFPISRTNRQAFPAEIESPNTATVSERPLRWLLALLPLKNFNSSAAPLTHVFASQIHLSLIHI